MPIAAILKNVNIKKLPESLQNDFLTLKTLHNSGNDRSRMRELQRLTSPFPQEVQPWIGTNLEDHVLERFHSVQIMEKRQLLVGISNTSVKFFKFDGTLDLCINLPHDHYAKNAKVLKFNPSESIMSIGKIMQLGEHVSILYTHIMLSHDKHDDGSPKVSHTHLGGEQTPNRHPKMVG